MTRRQRVVNAVINGLTDGVQIIRIEGLDKLGLPSRMRIEPEVVAITGLDEWSGTIPQWHKALAEALLPKETKRISELETELAMLRKELDQLRNH